MFRQAKKSDINSIARIHFIELNSDFLSSLGENFLRTLYSSFLQNKNMYTLVYELNGNVGGFITGAKNFDKDFNSIIKKDFIKFILIIIPQIFKNHKIIKKIIETLFYEKKQGFNLLTVELVVIAVLKKFHRKGIGKKLVFLLEKELIKNDIKQYKVSVNKQNKNANLFYKSLNFNKHNEFMLYGKRINLYVKNLK